MDPVGALTMPEMLAVVELAAPGPGPAGRQVRPRRPPADGQRLRLARKLPDWYQSATNVYWVVSALFNPVGTGLRYAASQVGLSQPFQMLHKNLLVWFYTAYIHRLGTYLVELNSGRLRIGVPRYRELLQRQCGATASRRRRQRRRGSGRGRAPRHPHPDGPGQGGQVEPGQRAAGRAAGAHRRAAGDGGGDALRVATRRHPDAAGAARHGRLRPYRPEGGPAAGDDARRPSNRICCCWCCTPATRPGRRTCRCCSS